MKSKKAFLTGLQAGGVSVLLMALVRAFGLPLRIELLIGTLFTTNMTAAWLIGLTLFLVGAGLVGMLYGAVFEGVAHRADATTGVVVALAHMVVSGALLAALIVVHPRVSELVLDPGPYMARMGITGILTFVALHLTYGALVGGLYGAVRKPRLRSVYV